MTLVKFIIFILGTSAAVQLSESNVVFDDVTTSTVTNETPCSGCNKKLWKDAPTTFGGVIESILLHRDKVSVKKDLNGNTSNVVVVEYPSANVTAPQTATTKQLFENHDNVLNSSLAQNIQNNTMEPRYSMWNFHEPTTPTQSEEISYSMDEKCKRLGYSYPKPLRYYLNPDTKLLTIHIHWFITLFSVVILLHYVVLFCYYIYKKNRFNSYILKATAPEKGIIHIITRAETAVPEKYPEYLI